MSEISHPPIRQDNRSTISIERIFAEEAYAMLVHDGVPLLEHLDLVTMTTLVTDYVDVTTEDDEVLAALRLRTLPVQNNSSDERIRMTPSEDYTAILLEYGESDTDNGTETFAQTYKWKSYILAVIDLGNLNNVSVLDAQTGQSLDSDDIGSAMLFLERMRRELRNTLFESTVGAKPIATNYHDTTIGGDYFPPKRLTIVPDCIVSPIAN
jgi:hypothetical protein